MRLIDADKTIGHIKTRLLETALNNCDAVCDASYLYQDCADNRIETWVDEMPTVDAEPIVRCKDCRFYVEDINSFVCVNGNLDAKPTDYCSWAERKEDKRTATYYGDNKPIETIVIDERREDADS